VRALFSTAALVSGGALKFKDADLSQNNTVTKDRKASAAKVSFKGGAGGWAYFQSCHFDQQQLYFTHMGFQPECLRLLCYYPQIYS
jgi:hypothetical protein